MMSFLKLFNKAKNDVEQSANRNIKEDDECKPRLKRPTRTFDEFFEHVNQLGFSPRTVIDVGAAQGTPPLQNAFGDAYFYWFEPLKEFAEKLKNLKKKYRGEVHNCALMAETTSGSIFKTKDLFGSSTMHRIADDSDERLQSVEFKTLDNVLSGKDIETPCLLKIDCQGSDFQVIQGGIDTLLKCDLVIMEVSFFKFWGAHHPDPLEIFNFMDKNGFVIYDILDGLFRPLDGALGQVDFVFVKRDGVFRKDHRWLEQ